MAHSLARIPPVTASIISTPPPKEKTRLPSFWFPRPAAAAAYSHDDHDSNAQPTTNRRTLALGLAGGLSGLIMVGGDVHNARAGKRKPAAAPPAAEDKKDPSVSGVLAKVLASKKRKEAMKQTVAALREKGKAIQGPSQ